MDENDLGMVLRVGRNGIMDILSFVLVYDSKHRQRRKLRKARGRE